MIYVLLSLEDTTERNITVNFVKDHIRGISQYKLLFMPSHIFEIDIAEIPDNSVLIWQPTVAYLNMDILKRYPQSVVVLEHPTILLQKQSRRNPITETCAVNNCFFIVYYHPERDDITNDNLRLAIPKETYLLTPKKLVEMIKEHGIEKDTTEIPDVFNEITSITKTQINLDE